MLSDASQYSIVCLVCWISMLASQSVSQTDTCACVAVEHGNGVYTGTRNEQLVLISESGYFGVFILAWNSLYYTHTDSQPNTSVKSPPVCACVNDDNAIVFTFEIDKITMYNFRSSSFEPMDGLKLAAKSVAMQMLYPTLLTKLVATHTGMNMYTLFLTGQQSRRQQWHRP